MANGLVQSRVSGWAAGAVCAAMYAGVTQAHDFVAPRSGWAMLLGTLASVVAGAVVYKVLLTLLIWLFKRSRLVRKTLLGARFVEGTWIGHYDRNGETLLTIEVIDQRDEQIEIAGRAIDRAHRLHTRWNSNSAAVTPSGKLLFYSYNCRVLAKNAGHEGMGTFQVDEIGGGEPLKLTGYSIDASDGQADANIEYKIGPIGMTDAAIFEEARKKFPAQFGTNWPTSP